MHQFSKYLLTKELGKDFHRNEYYILYSLSMKKGNVIHIINKKYNFRSALFHLNDVIPLVKSNNNTLAVN